MKQSKELGNWAEQLACDHIQQQGWQILARNYHCRSGELDIVACHQSTLAFIEVKYRRSNHYGGALASITPSKRRRLISAAQTFLQNYSQFKSRQARFDLIAISGRPKQQLKLQWLPAIFSLTE
jgi:putative endonuclease